MEEVDSSVKLSELKPNPSNPRFIKDDDYKSLVRSLKALPIMANKLRKIIIDEDKMILGGNMRHKAAVEAGIKELNVETFTRQDAEDNNKQALELDPDFKPKTYEEYCDEIIIKDNVESGQNDWGILFNEWDTKQLEDWGMKLPEDFGKVEIEEDIAPEVDEGGGCLKCPRHCLPIGKTQGDVWRRNRR